MTDQPSNIVWVVKRRVPLLPEQVVATKNTEAEADAECEVIRAANSDLLASFHVEPAKKGEH